jgi:phosphoglycolate phosphatase-like HAD superfamily hydrolase
LKHNDYRAKNKLAIVTRNSQKGLNHFKERLGNYSDCFSIYLSRDYLPYKPNPKSLLDIANRFGVSIGDVLMVGDSHHDMIYGKKANAQTCLFTTEEHWTSAHDKSVEEDEPDYIIHDLIDLVEIIND